MSVLCSVVHMVTCSRVLLLFPLTVGDVQKKWRNLRTQYLKEVAAMRKKGKSGDSGDSHQSKWRYFTMLNFLHRIVSTGPRRSNMEVFH